MNKQLINKRLVSYLFFIFAALLNFSCEKDNYVNRIDEENYVKVVVSSNTPHIPVKIEGFPLGGDHIFIRGNWEKAVITKAYGARVVATCDDKSVVMTIEIYVKDKLVATVKGDTYITTSVDIKKDRR